MTGLAWAIGFVALIAAIVIAGKVQGRRRTAAMRRVAETAGLTFSPTADLAAARALGDVPLFSRGRPEQITNLMSGQIGGQPVLAFDYLYSTGSGRAKATRIHTVVISRSAKPSLPDLQMMPENVVTRMAEAAGLQDIDIDASPEFSSCYIVRGPNETAIRAALYPQATSFFAAHRGWVVEAKAGTVALYRPMTVATPRNMRAYIDEACAAVRSL